MTVSKWSRPAREARRLTAEERTMRTLSERDFQRQVTDLAEVLGWTWVHFRAGMNARGSYAVQFAGPLGKGWPDLVLLRSRDRRLVFAELKRETGELSPEQDAVLTRLAGLASTSVEVHVWRPSDLERIAEVLR